MRLKAAFTLFLMLSICGGRAAEARAAAGQPDAARMRALAEAALDHRRAWEFFKCSFTIAVGTAADEESAVRAGPADAQLADGILVVDGPRIRFESNLDEATRAKERFTQIATEDKGNGRKRVIARSSLRINPARSLWDGARGVRYGTLGNIVTLTAPDAGGPRVVTTPLDLAGNMGRDEERHPAKSILKSKEDAAIRCVFRGEERIDGHDCEVIDIDEQILPGKDGSWHRTVYFDTERGCLPIKMEMWVSTPDAVTTVRVTDVRECSRGRWFPMRTVKVRRSKGAQADEHLDVTEIKVTQLDLDHRPQRSDFTIAVDGGALLNDNVHRGGQLVIASNRAIGLDDLDELSGHIVKAAERNNSDVTVEANVTTAPAVPTYRKWLIVGNVVIVVILTSLVAYRAVARRASKG